ncbi:hypothetical protein GCK32_004173 [Trichostrongylus colubriformis]|uniref:Uncharacterized protein n=1 Tax=Trichostrongylus colubriformis TaxID=6319 RepID=A0AAN8J1R7_TRICO
MLRLVGFLAWSFSVSVAVSNNATSRKENPGLLQNTLFWSLVTQFTFALVILVVTLHVWFNTKIQLVQRRLRLQEPSVHIVDQMAKKANINLATMTEEATTVFDCLMKTDASKSKETCNDPVAGKNSKSKKTTKKSKPSKTAKRQTASKSSKSSKKSKKALKKSKT